MSSTTLLYSSLLLTYFCIMIITCPLTKTNVFINLSLSPMAVDFGQQAIDFCKVLTQIGELNFRRKVCKIFFFQVSLLCQVTLVYHISILLYPNYLDLNRKSVQAKFCRGQSFESLAPISKFTL